jgi:hypothetical protein
VLGVDERADAARLLRLGDHVQRERRLARRLRAEDLDDAAARHAADAERVVELSEPVEMASIGAMAPFSPRRMIEPLPNCFSIGRRVGRLLRPDVPRALRRAARRLARRH